jgi:hypothetical protein
MMAFDNRRTYLCYNNRDLIRDGYIPTFIEKEYVPVSSFNITRLKNPPKGVTYIVGRDSATQAITSVRERKKLLPAEKLKIEIDFSKVMKNAVTHPIPPGPLVPGIIGGILGNVGMSAIGFGGISTGLTEMTYHALEARTRINQKVVITQDILDTSIIEFDGFPLSIFGIVKEHVENFGTDIDAANTYKVSHPQAEILTDVLGNVFTKMGLDFSAEQVTQLGRFSSGMFSGTGRKRISGATDSDGLFGGAGNAWLRIVENSGDSGETPDREVVLLGEQRQLFVKIVDDDRTLKFRGDNKEAVGGGIYPFQISGTTGIDVTDKQIRIDTTDLFVGNVVYVTLDVTVGDRHLRQNVEHSGSIAQGNTVGVIGFMGAIRSVQDIFDYRLRTWKVPPLSTGITISNIDEVTDNYTKDDDYKLTLKDFVEIDAKQKEDENFVLTGDEASEIEGWRLSEAILWKRISNFFAADYRGILYIKNRGIEVNVLCPRSSIGDQEWFTTYLESLDFTAPTGPVDPDDPVDANGSPKYTYLPSDLEKKIEDNIDFRDMEGFLFDLSEIVNSLLFDREKTHYYRPFANALKTVSSYREDDNTTGIGIPHLDLLPLICPTIGVSSKTEVIDGETITRREYSYTNFNYATGSFLCNPIDLNYYDLSYGSFDHVVATFAKTRSCEEQFNLRSGNYWSENYDALNDGPGAWYDIGYIENSVFEWRPDGGTIESYWKLETPYFCGEFNSNSRVYIEKMGGNSLDNYSWIYVDTEPFVPSNISADINYDYSSSMVVFSDNHMHDCLCYYAMNDNFFEEELSLIKIDKTKNHNRDTYEHVVEGQTVTEAFDHDQNLITGQNRILGDTPSYAYGVPITEEVFKVCSPYCDPDSDVSILFWHNYNLLTDILPDGSSFGLNLNDVPPRVSIPFNWYVKYVEIEFSHNPLIPIENIEKYVSFYFENTESSINNFVVTDSYPNGNNYVFRFVFKYYFGGPFQFLGNFWKKANIVRVTARFAMGNDESLHPIYNVDTYKIDSGQSAISYDMQGRVLVFYSNEETGNIDVAISYNSGETWVYDRNLIRLISGETATLPFVIKDTNSKFIYLFYVLNDKFVMYKKINSDFIDSNNALVTYSVPTSYQAGDYDLSLDDPERAYWGAYNDEGVFLRRELSYFVIGSATDDYFIEQQTINQNINNYNKSLAGTVNEDKIQTLRFVFVGEEAEMRDNFNGSPYAVSIADDGDWRIYFVSNNRLSIKRSRSGGISWNYDIYEQSIHKNYINDELNKGFTEDISNVQIVRNDFDASVVSILYFHNGMLFIRYFHTNLLLPWYDSEGVLQNQDMISHIEIIDADSEINPPTERTKNLPIFLVGTIPDSIKTTIKNDIDDDIPFAESDLAIYFPYKDPDDPEDKDANKAMVDIFNENFAIDTNTQVYAYVTARGLTRVFYKDNIGNIDGIIIDSLVKPNLEVMNVFKGV